MYIRGGKKTSPGRIRTELNLYGPSFIRPVLIKKTVSATENLCMDHSRHRSGHKPKNLKPRSMSSLIFFLIFQNINIALPIYKP